MPTGPKGQKRPADPIARAVKVMRIATGQEAEEFENGDEGKDAAAVSMGKRGGKARASKLTPEQRAEIARRAAAKRWHKKPVD